MKTVELTQEITLKNEAGETIKREFTGMEQAARWCLDHPDYGITLELDNDGNSWDSAEWQAVLDAVKE